MRLLIFYLLLVRFFVATGQFNLVPNPSFEESIQQCGLIGDDFAGQDRFSELVSNWYRPTLGSTDIRSLQQEVCPLSTDFKIEGINIGLSQPSEGNSMAALVLNRNVNENREYLQTQLLEPLQINQSYCVEFKALSANFPYRSNNLGVLLSSDKVIRQDLGRIDSMPQFNVSNVISNTVDWETYIFDFNASDNFRYITFGNFFENNQTQMSLYNEFGTASYGSNDTLSYVFLDEIQLYKQQSMDQIKWIVKDTIVCPGEYANFRLIDEYAEIVWHDLAGVVLASGEFFSLPIFAKKEVVLKRRLCKQVVYDTLTIEVRDVKPFDLGDDTLLCADKTINFSLPSDYSNILWDDNSIARNREIKNSGMYGYEALDKRGCIVKDSFVVEQINLPVIPIDSAIYLCEPLVLSVPNSSQLYVGQDLIQDQYVITNSGQVEIEVINQCGEISDVARVQFIDEILYPNIITPNGDGKNDELKFTQERYNGMQLEIYNRWGTRVYKSDNYLNSWHAINQKDGVYYYSSMVKGCNPVKSWLNVIR